MPNYTHNTLIVTGTPEGLRYFYNRNAVDADASLHTANGIVRPLSFNMCCPRESFEKIIIQTESESPADMWSTKWDAICPTVDMSTIENGMLTYDFKTAWNEPYNWVLVVSDIFKDLTFELRYTTDINEGGITFRVTFKAGVVTSAPLALSGSHLDDLHKQGEVCDPPVDVKQC
jgi:hypothetical protein